MTRVRLPSFVGPVAALVVLAGCGLRLQDEYGPRDRVGGVLMATRPDLDAEDRLLAQAASVGDPRALVEQASRLRAGRPWWPENEGPPAASPEEEAARVRESGRRHAEAEVEAARLDRAAAERGDPVAMVNAGVLCLANKGPMRYLGAEKVDVGACNDEAEAVRWFRLAMEKGSARGMAYYGYMTELGRGGLKRDPEAARRYYREAAARGYADAARMLEDMTRFRGKATP
jgi:TPR repeat protein